MRQILHIFRKDLRRFWPEILISFALLASFVWVAPHQWLPADAAGARPFGRLDLRHVEMLANTLMVLIPVSWLLLITRVVHDENLVSNRAFWLTRPYRWQLLLAAKLLFCLLCILLPLLIEQTILLSIGGFQPRLHLYSLFYVVALFSTVLLPMLTFATITSSLLRLIVTLIAISVLVVAAAFLDTTFDSYSNQVPAGEFVFNAVLMLVCAIVVIIQYSTRRLWLSRALLIAVVGTIVLVMSGPFDNFAIDHIYARSSASPAIALISSKESAVASHFKNEKLATIDLPVQLSGAPSDFVFIPDNLRLTISSSNGLHWTSPWQASYNVHLVSTAPNARVSVDVDRAFLNRIKDLPVSLHLELALTRLAATSRVRSVFPEFARRIPGLGICSGRNPGLYPTVEIFCRGPFSEPITSRLEIPTFESDCSDVNSSTESDAILTGWTGVLEPGPGTLDLSPIKTNSVIFTNPESKVRHTVCAGLPMIITRYRFAERLRADATLTEVTLPQVEQFGISGLAQP